MTCHDLRCLIARYSIDPDNAEAMAMARFYSDLLALMSEGEDAV